MDRRTFLKDAATTLLVLAFGTSLVQCDDESGKSGSNASEHDDTPPDAPPRAAGTNIVYTSSETEGHSHSFTVPRSAFESAPLGGITGLTTEAQGHQHRLTIDQEALRRVAAGDVAKVETEDQAEHTHVFTIVKID
ncbi:MAG: twin-arginine translocation signal domain-containing protein [Labilithrix sp.]|nr:twin-arginine translocation signal domain-containing protein [Labilithrix sp.]MCW5837288.1 twin-arginine translocation signal domain-containing protein [Labilithrix sp.]